MKNADEGGEDEKIFLSAKEKEGDLVQKEAQNAQVQVDYYCRALSYPILTTLLLC